MLTTRITSFMICSESSPAPMHVVASPGGGNSPCPVRFSSRVTADGVGLYGDAYRYANAR
tara:strand:+ start:424 stop:603 length:180 start_codon:yes stop_codon:yes gene_type:complete